MTKLLGVVLAAAVLIGISAGAVEVLDDRDLLVPPPEAVAEGFMREVVTRRWSRARQFLADPRSMSDDELESLQQSIEGRVGDPLKIEAEEFNRSGDRALVHVRLSSGHGSEAIAYELVFDREWKVATP